MRVCLCVCVRACVCRRVGSTLSDSSPSLSDSGPRAWRSPALLRGQVHDLAQQLAFVLDVHAPDQLDEAAALTEGVRCM